MTDDRHPEPSPRDVRADAVRLLAALRNTGPRVRDDELADAAGVRADHLERVADLLRNAGLLRWEHRLEPRGDELFLVRYARRVA